MKKIQKPKAERIVGRPTKYKPEYCDLLIKEMETGLSYEGFAGVVEVGINTLYEWEAAHPEFYDAKKIAFAKSRAFWERLGIRNIMNISEKSSSLNSAVWIFNMKNRFKWTDRTIIEESNQGALSPKEKAIALLERVKEEEGIE